jgi:peptidoglycan/LPS O-acetylase OafA/YrhL
MSAERLENGEKRPNWLNFFTRRYFRIAPAYYFAGLCYCILEPERLKSITGVLVFALFLNSWYIVDVGQQLVYGGWSISVEFSFYLLFPFLFHYVRTIPRSIAFLFASIAIAICINQVLMSCFSNSKSHTEIANFNFFSFWNQLPIFALANFAYLTMYRPAIKLSNPFARICLSKTAQLSLIVVFLVVLAYTPLPRSFTLSQPWVPGFFAAACCFSILCALVADDLPKFLVNRWLRGLGRISFSAYLWHWLVMDLFSKLAIGRWLLSQKSILGIFAYFAVLAIVLGFTWAIATVSFRFIEIPGISIGKKLSTKKSKP